ncbi:GCG_CRPN prefix-to-repeats domain-containing protein [Methylorubrum rhodinum]|uniref:GCG_CRPN prefix-to-repeats domain-containing protein n=1 Tax=Methylorubrum rhodinum TaxID=29428 RepID=UPI000B0162EA|nr:hypothetical protein [Methylorubrum rhodinum]
MMHAKAFTLTAVVAGSLGFMGSAQAAPLSPAPLATGTDGALIERTAGYCGPGFHPNWRGVCVMNQIGPDGSYRRRGGPYGYGGGYGRPRPYGYYRPRPDYY